LNSDPYVIAMNPQDYYNFKLEEVLVLSLEDGEIPSQVTIFLSSHPVVTTLEVETGTYWFGPLKQVMEKSRLI